MISQQANQSIDVIIPIFNAYESLQKCLTSVIRHFNDQARLILIDDCSSDPRIKPLLWQVRETTNLPVLVKHNETNQGFIKTVNYGMQLSSQNDVILLNSDTIVTRNWIHKLHQAAYRQDNIATVTPLSNNATIFSVPEFGTWNGLPTGYNIDAFAELIEKNSLFLYPEVPTGHGFCIYITRKSLNLLGLFDERYGRGCEEENDFCLRALSHCLLNIMADDTFIYHAGKASYQGEHRKAIEQSNRDILLNRYPFYLDLINSYQNNRTIQIWDNINAHLYGLRVGFDGRCLNDNLSGTQRYLLELIKAYTQQNSTITAVDLLISDGSRKAITKILEGYNLPQFPRLVEESQLTNLLGECGWDIFHVTFQGISIPDIAKVRPYAKRIINTFQDLILARNPYYFNRFSDFENYRFHLKVILESVDGIIVISNYMKQELLTTYCIDPKRFKTIYHGVNWDRAISHSESSCFWEDLIGQPYLLFVGNDFLHKNLEATVNVWKTTRQQGYPYQLVIVGSSVLQGGVKEKIQAELEADSQSNQHVFFLNHVDDQQLTQLYQNAGVLLYLSNSEGFGLPPLEAFANDCPVIASNLTSIPEVLGEAASCFHPGEIDQIAWEVIRLIENSQLRDRAIQKGRERVKQFDWNQTAQQTINFYYELLRHPPNPQQELPYLHLNFQKLKQTQLDLNQSNFQSKFWKFREAWFWLKKKVRLI